MKLFEFDTVIYPRKLWIVKNTSDKEIQKMFCERNGNEMVFDDDEGNESNATVYPSIMRKDTRKYGYLVHVKRKISVGDISNEALHVSTELFREIGAYLDPNNQEPFAYLLGWVSECIDKAVKNKVKEWEDALIKERLHNFVEYKTGDGENLK